MALAADLEVAQPAGEVQDVTQVSLGVAVVARGLGQTQLLGDGVQLQGAQREHLAGSQQLFTYQTNIIWLLF